MAFGFASCLRHGMAVCFQNMSQTPLSYKCNAIITPAEQLLLLGEKL